MIYSKFSLRLFTFLHSHCSFPSSPAFSFLIFFFVSVSLNTFSIVSLSSFFTLSSVLPRCHGYSCEAIIASRKSTADTEEVFRAHTRWGAIVFRQLLVPLLLALHQTTRLNGGKRLRMGEIFGEAELVLGRTDKVADGSSLRERLDKSDALYKATWLGD